MNYYLFYLIYKYVKSTKIILLILNIFISLIINAQHKSKISAKGFAKYNGDIVEIHYIDYDSTGPLKKMVTIKVNDGKFTASIPMSNPAMTSYIYFPKLKKQFLLILDTGYVNIILPDLEKINVNLVKNSKTNSLFWSAIDLENSNIYNGKPTGNQTYNDVRRKVLAYIKQHPSNFYSLIHIAKCSYYLNSIGSEYILSAYNAMDSSLKMTTLGKWLANRLINSQDAYSGKKLPEFEFYTEDGKLFNNKNLAKKTYLLAFSASWCGPCKKQIPILKELQKEFINDSFEIVYINMDPDKDKWKKMISDYELGSFINLTDNSSLAQSTMANRFFIIGVPTNILIDFTSTIQYNSAELGDFDLKVLSEYLKDVF